MVSLRHAAVFVSIVALLPLAAGCGGEREQRLADGGKPPALPAPLSGLDGAVMTRVSTVPAREIETGRLEACGSLPGNDRTAVAERVGLDGTSLTFAGGPSVTACDAIPGLRSEPDTPYGGIWCGSAVGRVEDGRLTDPRLDLCTGEAGGITAFAWVEPGNDAAWIAVVEGDRRDVYAVAGSRPVRLTTVEGVHVARSAASFEIEEYAADGRRVRAYTLNAAVAG